ncbi:D-alanyl-D-alanine carboxypeptidase family protein [Paenibacillus sp.]|uniref:D-alanyl-D-alanine carboxypeptidase family protein n=1 Tax=Paenibacillus sp. TaxID=58172 RepID=UPI0028111C7F|nr:D-alanyl-D-alanine carboxypeptidase family protein [Paenibacillus sp.]
MMKHAALRLALPKSYHWPMTPNIRAKAGIVIDAKSGEALFAKAANQPVYPASMTKIMTTLLLLEACADDETFVVGDEIRQREDGESSAGLLEGETRTAGSLAEALMLASGNDAARTVARQLVRKHCGKTLSAERSMVYFAELMNWKARELGAANTRFANAHGLHDPNHVSTAADLARIARRAMRNERFRELAGRKVGADGRYRNRNLLLQPDSPFYDAAATGLKTGFTSAAGYCLAASASAGGVELIAIVLRSTEDGRWTDARKLLDYGFRRRRGIAARDCQNGKKRLF